MNGNNWPRIMYEYMKNGGTENLKPCDYIQIQGAEMSEATPIEVPETCVLALLKAEGATVRLTNISSQTPTADFGWPLDPGDILTYDTPMTDIQVIATSPLSVLNIMCFAEID